MRYYGWSRVKCVREISVVWGVVCRILTRGRVVFDIEKGVVGSVIGSGEGDSIRRVGIYREDGWESEYICVGVGVKEKYDREK